MASFLSTGSLVVWASFLIQSGIAKQTLELVPKAKAMWDSLRAPDWAPSMRSFGDFTRSAAYPVIVIVAALVFTANEYERANESQAPQQNGIDTLSVQLDEGLKRIEAKLGSAGMFAALDKQGYTSDRANLIDRLETMGGNTDQRPPDYHYFRFLISFERGSLDESRAALDAGVKVSDRGQELIEYIASALLPLPALRPCGWRVSAPPTAGFRYVEVSSSTFTRMISPFS